jgi:hypothetical protein
MRELTKSMLSLSLALPLLGAQQAARILSPARRGRPATEPLDTVADAARRRLGGSFETVYRTGEMIQGGALDMAGQALTPDLLDPATWARLAGDMALRSAEGFRLMLSGSAGLDALREVANKVEVYALVREVGQILGVPQTFPLPLHELLRKAYELSPFQTLWAVEGLGHDYGKSYWDQGIIPRGLLTDPRTYDLPAKSLLMLHAGIGLAFAEHLLDGTGRDTPFAEIRRLVAEDVLLCRQNSRQGYLGAAYESLGLVTRLFHGARLAAQVDRALREVAPEVRGFFWHGVGRAIYFLPQNFLPCSTWQTFEMARREAPDEMARLNAVAGTAWAVTLVNQRQPEILANLVVGPHGDQLAPDGAFSNGLASAVIMRADTTPDAALTQSFLDYRPSRSDVRLVRLWDELVRRPAELALHVYYPIFKANDALGDLFHYGDLARLAATLAAGGEEPLGPPPAGNSGAALDAEGPGGTWRS